MGCVDQPSAATRKLKPRVGVGTTNLIGEFYGIHEDNDPDRRLSVVINYNMDIGDYMEWSATGRYVVSPTNEAYKFAINYLVYGLTH